MILDPNGNKTTSSVTLARGHPDTPISEQHLAKASQQTSQKTTRNSNGHGTKVLIIIIINDRIQRPIFWESQFFYKVEKVEDFIIKLLLFCLTVLA